MTQGLLKTYLEAVRLTRGHGVAETSYYPALKALFDAVGGDLRPKVTLVLHPRSQGAGIPDGGLFLDTKAMRAGQGQPFEDERTLPDRGALEVKPPSEDVDAVAQSEQGRRYTAKYGHLLVTNLRHFALYRRTANGPQKIDEIVLASSESDFWSLASHPAAAERRHGAALREFLTRACMAGAPLDKPQTVAEFLASYAREALQRAEQAPDDRTLQGVRAALEDALGVTFDEGQGRRFFLSTLVQTLFYGLFSAWVLAHEKSPRRGEPFRLGDTYEHLRLPMIEPLFRSFSGPGTLDPLGLRELLNRAVDVLNRVERGPFFQAFGEGDAVQYFYEPFLAAFDPELRKELGVWYTPKEIVRYQVRRVDALLRERLGVANGLADGNVVILDPCCGTGTYLVEVLDLIDRRLREQHGEALAPGLTREAASKRVFGFELIPAPYVIAHLQLGLRLSRAGAGLPEDGRALVFLTNALTGWDPREDVKQQLDLYGLQKEREAALKVKREEPILVILGNPPYNGFAGVTESSEERALTEFYRRVSEAPAPQGQGLNDLYVRFYRMAERRITEGPEGRGIVCFISNYSWLDSLSCTGMRERFRAAFDEVWIDNMHGDKYATGKLTPEGRPDPSVFSTSQNREGIQVGTAIVVLVRTRGQPGAGDGHRAKVRYRDLWGARKRDDLIESLDEAEFAGLYSRLEPQAALGFPFKPRTVTAAYLEWPRLPELIPKSFPGVQTSRDEFLVDIDRERLEARLTEYFDERLSDDDIHRSYPSVMEPTSRFKPKETRKGLLRRGRHPDGLRRFAFRPFDVRWLYWDPYGKLLDEKRSEYRVHAEFGTIGMFVAKDNRRGFDAPGVTAHLGCRHLVERGGNSFLSRLAPPEQVALGLSGPLTSDWRATLANISVLAGDVCSHLRVVDADLVFFHALATMHSPAYREANAGALRQDWPRIPWPRSSAALAEDPSELAAALEASAALGCRVAALLDPETPVEGVTAGDLPPAVAVIARFEALPGAPPGPPSLRLQARWGFRGQGGVVMPAAGRVTEAGAALIVHANAGFGWHGVPREVWEYKLGGYQVLKKWLSYREREVLGRDLLPEEAVHFAQTARRIAALLALGPELDAAHARVRAALG
jgi:hypothetical protein